MCVDIYKWVLHPVSFMNGKRTEKGEQLVTGIFSNSRKKQKRRRVGETIAALLTKYLDFGLLCL